MRPYETKTHIMRAGRLVPKPKPVTLPLNDPLPLLDANSDNPLEASIARARDETEAVAEDRNLSAAW